MNIWLLTEERPKISVLKMILGRFCDDYQKEYLETEAVQGVITALETVDLIKSILLGG